MIFGSLICYIRKYHKFSYYYSGECITCGKIRREHEEREKQEEKIDLTKNDEHTMNG